MKKSHTQIDTTYYVKRGMMIKPHQPVTESHQPLEIPHFVKIGCGTYWGQYVGFTSFHPDEKITIGKYCSIAPYVEFWVGGEHCTEFAFCAVQKKKKTMRNTVVGNDVWIGHGAQICSGCQVGHGAIIGSRSVVFGDIPPYAIVLGNPAKVLRFRFSKPIIEKMLKIAWWDWPAKVVQKRSEWLCKPIQEFVNEFAPVSEVE